MWQNTKTQNVTTQNSKCEKTQKLKMWQNSKTQNGTKLKCSKCEEEKTRTVKKIKM